MKKGIVTTSWDDGHVLDAKIENLLVKYDLAGTFYIAPENREIPANERLNKEQVRHLADRFEVGAHTMTHPRLSSVDQETAQKEISDSKALLEDWTGQPVSSFCYPGGDNTLEHRKLVKDAGFRLARTTTRFSSSIGTDPFALPTTVHAYRHWSDATPIFKAVGLKHFLGDYLNWDRLAIDLFDATLENEGVFHLWGHSWEIEKNHDWDRLERVFAHISRRPEVAYLKNSELI